VTTVADTFTILLVEDDAVDQAAFRQFVKSKALPWNYGTAASIKEGRQRLKEQKFDVVLTDFSLPDGNAFELFDDVGDQVVILVTGVGDEEMAVRALKSGFSDYLVKRMDRSHLSELPAKIEIAQRQRQTRLDLRESEARLRDLFDTTDNLIQSVSPDGTILLVNPSWCRALGYAQSEVVGLKIFNLIHESCRLHCGAIFERLMQGEDQNEIEVTFVAKDGHRVEVEGRLGVRRKDGQIVSTRGVFSDITGRRAQDQQLKLLQTCLARVEDVVMITEAEPFELPGPRIVYVNDAFDRMTGYTRAEALGNTPRMMQGPDIDRTEVRRVSTALRKWETVTTTLLNHKKDGTKFWNEMTITPVADPSGWFTHWVAIERDVTKRRAEEEELRQLTTDLENRVLQRSGELAASEARFQQLAGAIDDVFWLKEAHPEKILYISPAYERIWGRTCDSLMHSPLAWLEAVHPDDRAFVHAALLKDQLVGKYDVEYRIVRPDGEVRWIHERAYLVKASARSGPAIAGVASDVTQAKLMQQQVLRSQRVDSIGTLAGGVAHDLNNALAPILMANELLRAAYPNATKYVQMIENSANRCAAMVRQLLVFARGYEGIKADMDPKLALAELATIVESTFPKSIQFVHQVAPDLASISSDPTQFHQVLLNLCVNARDAMESGGLLQLEAENVEIDSTYAAGYSDAKPGKYVAIRVKDSGRGMPPDVIAKIFDPFFTTKAPDKGTGLGLSTVAGIMRGHGGFIRVYSTPGKGSLFAIYFPIAEDNSKAAPGSGAPLNSATAPGKYQGHGEGILVVDDEPMMREIATEVLTALGFSVTVASDGTDALMKVAEMRNVLKLVITDLHMPHLDGLGFARVLRRMAPEMKIIITSGRMETRDIAEFENLGVTHFLTKPFNQLKLVTAMQELIPMVPPGAPRL
jgi:PAS domain S-box-containing protein